VIATGTPEDVAQVDGSYTGQLLRGILGAEDKEPGRAA
jgi:excinuclease UvrABC ATPase subunit